MEGSFTLALTGPCAWGDTLGGLWGRNRTTLILSVMHTTSQCMVLPTYHNAWCCLRTTMGGKVDMVLDLVWCTLKSLSYQKETSILIATVHMPYYYNYD